MDLKTLILLLENKIKSKDFVLPYNSKSLDASTIQNLNQNLSPESLENIISEILNQNVTSFVQNTESQYQIDQIEPGNNNIYTKSSLGLSNVSNTTSLENIISETLILKNTEQNKITEELENQEQHTEIWNKNYHVSKEPLNSVGEKKNMLLLNFLMFSNKQVIEYVKIFSFSTDFHTITSSYNQLINFLGYYKISSIFLDGIDEFAIVLNYFKKDLSNTYYTFLHIDYNSGLNQLIASNKISSQIDYLEVVDNLDKSQQEFSTENEKILEKSNNEINNLISQKRQRKIILSGLLMLGSYVILAKTGMPLMALTKLLFSPSSINISDSSNLSQIEMGPFDSSLQNIKPQDGLFSENKNIRFRDLYDLALKILYKKLNSI